jgi:hypothetical protein
MLLALQFSPVYVLSTNANDYLIRRTNKSAGISVITGLAFVVFAGLCITYQDRLRQKFGNIGWLFAYEFLAINHRFSQVLTFKNAHYDDASNMRCH